MKHNLILAFDFAKRDFNKKYVGTGLGQFWYILSPVITIFIYTVIFSDFMKMKLNVVDSSYAYSIYIVPGLLAWLSFSKILSLMTNAIAAKANLIKKINVPMYVFFLSIFITEFALFLLSISLGILFLLSINYTVNATFLWMLPIMLLQTLFAFALGVIIALFVPFFKDLKEAVPIFIQLWFWATPIIYLKEMIANKYPFILTYNPFYHYVHLYQDIFLYAKAPSVKEILIITLITFTTLSIAIYLYKKMIGTIKDII